MCACYELWWNRVIDSIGRKVDIPAAWKWDSYREISRLKAVSASTLSTYAKNIHEKKSDQPSLWSNCKGKRSIVQRIDWIMVRKLLGNRKAASKKVQRVLRLVGSFFLSNIEPSMC